jgi:hypothetical protein
MNMEDRLATLAARGLELGDPVDGRLVIKAPPNRIWQVISQPGHLARCHPFCEKNEVDQWPGVCARDTITYYSGVHYQRDFVTWIEGVGYDLELGPPPHKTAWVSWRITPLDETRSELMIEVTPYLKSALPERRKLAYQRRAFGTTIADYLNSVVQGVDYVVTTGQAVRRNQFGSHPIYS